MLTYSIFFLPLNMTHEWNCMQIQQIDGPSLYLFIKAQTIPINVFTSFPESIFLINIFHLFGRGRPFLPLDRDDKVLIKRHATSCIWECLISQALRYSGGQSALQVSAVTMVTSPSPAGERSPLLPTDSLTPAFLWLLSAKAQHATEQMLHEGESAAYRVLFSINGSQETLITRRCCNP